MTTYIDNEEKLKNIIEQAKEIIQDIESLEIERITEEMEKLEKRLEFQVVEKYDDEKVWKYFCEELPKQIGPEELRKEFSSILEVELAIAKVKGDKEMQERLEKAIKELSF